MRKYNHAVYMKLKIIMINRFIIASFFMVSFLLAQFLWQDNGIALRQGVHIEWQRTVVDAEPGTVIIVWSDVRNGIRDVYAQKIDTTGNLLWGTDGLAVTTSPGRQEDPVAITDGNGGVFIAWVDYRNGDMSDIYIQHLNSTGQMVMDFDGVPLCIADSVQISISMCTDSLGGAYIVWQDKRFGVDEDIYGTHIDAAHNIIAPGDGIAIAAGTGSQSEKSLEYAGDNQALLVWKDTYSVNTNIFAQRLNDDMTFHWIEKLPVAQEGFPESQPRTTFMRNDTNIVVWQITNVTDQIRYQLITSDGLVFSHARLLTNDSDPQSSPRVKRDNHGNVFVVWQDYRHDPIDFRFYAQKVLPDGNVVWDSSAIALDNSSTRSGQARFAPDEAGGLWCSWEAGVFPEIDIKVQHLAPDGTVLLGDSGLVAFEIPDYQFSPILLPDGGHGVFITIGNQPTGSISLRSQRVNSSGALDFGTTGELIKQGMDGDVNYVQAFSYDQETTYLIWEDGRNASRTYGLAVDSTGLKDLSFNNLNGTELVSFPVYSDDLISEPYYLFHNDNFYIGSYKLLDGSKSLQINKLNPQFQNSWDPQGLTVYSSLADQLYANLQPSGNGLGVIWSEIRNFIDYDLYYQKFDESGTAQLAIDGVVLSDVSWKNEYIQAVFPAPNDEFIAIWMEDAWHAQDLYAQRFTTEGLVASGWPVSGVPICTAFDDQRNVVAIELALSQGIFIVWEDLRSGTVDLYGQILGWDGSLAWEADGIPVTIAPNDQTDPVISYDPAYNRILVVWEDFRDSNDYNIYGQLVDLNTLSLIDTQIVICGVDKYQANPAVENVYPGTFLITWEDERGAFGETPVVSGGLDVYAQVYQIGVGLVYPVGGIPIVQEYHNQLYPQIVKLYSATSPEDDRWLIYWRDLRSSGKADIAGLYSQLIRVTDVLAVPPDGQYPTEFKVYPAYPNPFNGSVSFSVDIPAVQPVTLSIYNLLGQTVYQEKILPLRSGHLEFSWDGRSQFHNELSSGVYLYSLSVAEIRSTGKITYLK